MTKHLGCRVYEKRVPLKQTPPPPQQIVGFLENQDPNKVLLTSETPILLPNGSYMVPSYERIHPINPIGV